jgi:hypothetical protein
MMVDQSYEYNGPAGLIAQVDRNGKPVVRHQELMPQGSAAIIAQVDRNGNAVRHHDLLPQNGGIAKQGIVIDSVQLAVSRQPCPPAGGSVCNHCTAQRLAWVPSLFHAHANAINSPLQTKNSNSWAYKLRVRSAREDFAMLRESRVCDSQGITDGPLEILTP